MVNSKITILISLLLGVVCCKSRQFHQSDLTIFNAQGVADSYQPEVVKITADKRYICSGTFVAEQVVLTAAHCVVEQTYKILEVGGGGLKRDVKVIKSFVHPRFLLDGGYCDSFDVALLVVDGRSDTFLPVGTGVSVGAGVELVSYGPSFTEGFGKKRAGYNKILSTGAKPMDAAASVSQKTSYEKYALNRFLSIVAPMPGSNSSENRGVFKSDLKKLRSGTIPGDSGSPLLMRIGAQNSVVGVDSSGAVGGANKFTSYVDVSWEENNGFVDLATGPVEELSTRYQLYLEGVEAKFEPFNSGSTLEVADRSLSLCYPTVSRRYWEQLLSNKEKGSDYAPSIIEQIRFLREGDFNYRDLLDKTKSMPARVRFPILTLGYAKIMKLQNYAYIAGTDAVATKALLDEMQAVYSLVKVEAEQFIKTNPDYIGLALTMSEVAGQLLDPEVAQVWAKRVLALDPYEADTLKLLNFYTKDPILLTKMNEVKTFKGKKDYFPIRYIKRNQADKPIEPACDGDTVKARNTRVRQAMTGKGINSMWNDCVYLDSYCLSKTLPKEEDATTVWSNVYCNNSQSLTGFREQIRKGYGWPEVRK